MVIIVVACLGDLQLFITFTNIYRVKLEIACVRMSFENIYIYIYVLYVYICICTMYIMSMSLRLISYYVSFTPLSLLVSTYCKEGTFLMHFSLEFFAASLSLSLPRSSIWTAKFASIFLCVWDLYLCNGRGDIHHLLCSLFCILHWHL